MPSKAYYQRQKRQKRYKVNAENARESAIKQYVNNREAKLEQAKLTRSTDKQFRKRQSSAKTRCVQNNSAQTQKQRSRVLENTRRRLAEDPDYRAKNRETTLRNTKKRLEQNPEYRAKNRQTALQNTRRRLKEDTEYRAKHRRLDCAVFYVPSNTV